MKLKNMEQLVVLMADYHDRKLKDTVIMQYAEDLRDNLGLSVEEAAQSWKVWRCDMENPSMPKPAHLKQIANPTVSDRVIADTLSTKLITAVSRKGRDWIADDGWDEFMERIGQVGAEVVHNRGGWRRFCEWVDASSSQETFKAQLRDEIQSTMSAARAGVLNKPAALPEADTRVKQLSQDMGKKMTLESGGGS